MGSILYRVDGAFTAFKPGHTYLFHQVREFRSHYEKLPVGSIIHVDCADIEAESVFFTWKGQRYRTSRTYLLRSCSQVNSKDEAA